MKKVLSVLLLAAFLSCGNSDKDVQKNIDEKFANNPNVKASVKDGVVTLTGSCPDESCKTIAEATAKDVKGVKRIDNQINVAAPVAPEPTVMITEDASLKNSVDSVVKNYKGVKAEVADGVVTLTGEIKRAQLSELMQDVSATKPKKIDNKLQIK
jgi:osmotically-inducible protein OsmY